MLFLKSENNPEKSQNTSYTPPSHQHSWNSSETYSKSPDGVLVAFLE